MFQCAFFHLLGNAVKHGSKGSEIQISVFEKQGQLITQIVNSCDKINLKTWEKAMTPVFAFERMSAELNETSGVGIGISTASTLAEVINGQVDFKVDFNLRKVTTSLRLNLNSTSPSGQKDRNEDFSPTVIGIKKFKMAPKLLPQVN